MKCYYGVFCTALLLAGCQEDEIRRYRVPKAEAPLQAAASDKPMRLLGAILPRPEISWFFKLTGDPKEIEGHQDAFERFVRSVRFTGKEDAPVEWTVPESWRPGPAKPERYATFLLGAQEPPLELAVSRFGGTLLGNVNRWRGQLGLEAITEAELPQQTKQWDVGGVHATVVDITGRAADKKGMAPPFAGGRRHPPVEAEPKIGYRLPEGWQELPPRSVQYAAAAFQVGEGEQGAIVAISPLAGPGASDVLENVNRWRGQVGLGRVDDAQLQKDIKEIEVAGTPAYYVDLNGESKRILGVMAARGEQLWFIKMTGPTELVGRQKTAFETFVRSVRFDSGAN